MNFLKTLFSQKQEKTLPEITHLIYVTGSSSLGYNDGSEITDSQKGIILCAVSSKESAKSKFEYWNKKFYNSIQSHFMLDYDQIESVSGILGLDKSNLSDWVSKWPDPLTLDTYHKIYEILNLNLVTAVKLDKIHKGKYAIVFNENFFTGKDVSISVLNSVIDTYEKIFDDFELIHDNIEIAFLYGIIIYDRICTNNSPDTYYHYKEKIKSQTSPSFKFKSLEFNPHLYTIEEKKDEYQRIIKHRLADLEYLEKIYKKIKTPPFRIIQL